MLSERRKAQLGLSAALFTLGICTTVLVHGAYYGSPIPFAGAGIIAPNFTLPDVEARPVSLSDFRGKTIVLCFGSTRCPKTNAYNDRVTKLAREFADDNRVQFLAINVAHTPIDPREVRVDARITERPFPTLIDDRAHVADLFSAADTPKFVVIDPQGVVSYRGEFDDNANPKLVTHRYCAEKLFALLGHRPDTTLAAVLK